MKFAPWERRHPCLPDSNAYTSIPAGKDACAPRNCSQELPKETKPMLTKRDLFVALIAASLTLCAIGFVRAGAPVMGSSAFDWNKIEVKPNKTGATRQFFRAPTATLDELECHVTTLNPGESPHPPHKHPDEEVMVIREGTVESLLNGQWQRLGPGSVIFQASNQEHAIRNVGTTPATYHVFKWNSPGMLKAKEAAKPQD